MEGFYFQSLRVYQEAKALVKETYALMRKFPQEEKYALCDQLRRAILSVPSNIAEGVGRTSAKEKAHFLDIAIGSLMESFCQLDVAKDLGYISDDDLDTITPKFIAEGKLLNAFKASILKNTNN